MAALARIAGIMLERCVELCAKRKDCGGHLEVCARIAAENGVARGDWEAAMNGWNARMQDPATAGQVALAYMPLYQAALAAYGGPVATASYEDYIEMSALINTDMQGTPRRPTDFDAMYTKFGIDAPKWSQISTCWVDRLNKDPQLGADYGQKVRARVKELDNSYRQQAGVN